MDTLISVFKDLGIDRNVVEQGRTNSLLFLAGFWFAHAES
jgi:hypothetical protein